MLNFLKKLVREEEGQDFVEYALLLSGIVLASIGLIAPIGTAIAGIWGQITTALT